MLLRSRRVRFQIASVLFVRLPHVTTPQELGSARTQGNCQGKKFPIPKASQTKKKEKEPGGEQIEVTTNSDSNGGQITHTTYEYFRGHHNKSTVLKTILKFTLKLT